MAVEHPPYSEFIENGGEPIRPGFYRYRNGPGREDWARITIKHDPTGRGEFVAVHEDGTFCNAEAVWTRCVDNPINANEFRQKTTTKPEAKAMTTEATIEQSDTTNDLFAALASAQGKFPSIPKNREVRVRTKSGDGYSFHYATLDGILDTLRPILAEHNLSVIQLLAGQFIATQLSHGSGQWIRSRYPVVVEGSGNQARGSAITYARRYALSALLNIAPDDDDDGNAADGNEVETVKDKPKAPTGPAGKATPPKSIDPAAWWRGGSLVIPVKPSEGLQAWHGRFIKALTSAPDIDALNRLVSDNGVTLDGMQAENAKAYAVLTASIKAQTDKLATQVAAE